MLLDYECDQKTKNTDDLREKMGLDIGPLARMAAGLPGEVRKHRHHRYAERHPEPIRGGFHLEKTSHPFVKNIKEDPPHGIEQSKKTHHLDEGFLHEPLPLSDALDLS